MKRKILGTNKFIVRLYNGKMVRGGTAKPKSFVYRQWGRVWKVDEQGNEVGVGYPFTNYGEMLSFINKIMQKQVRGNLKAHKTWT